MIDALQARLQLQRGKGLWREPKLLQRLSPTTVTDGVNTYLNFSSNDYLSLSGDKRLRENSAKEYLALGVGSGGSPLVTGVDTNTQALQESFAKHVSMPRSLFMHSGYIANLSLINAVVDDTVTVFIDKLAHASFYDALQMKAARFKRYRHLDFSHLTTLLADDRSTNKLIISEGVFSMTGMRPDFSQLKLIKEKFNAMLLIDDAHAVGVMGEQGEGSVSDAPTGSIDILVSSLNKAMATSGAMISAHPTVIESVIQFARPYCYSSALPKAHVASVNAHLSAVQQAVDKRQSLANNIAYFRDQAQPLAAYLTNSDSAIQLLQLGDVNQAQRLALALMDKGIYVYPMRPPSLPLTMCGLRVVLNAAHQTADIEQLIVALVELL